MVTSRPTRIRSGVMPSEKILTEREIHEELVKPA